MKSSDWLGPRSVSHDTVAQVLRQNKHRSEDNSLYSWHYLKYLKSVLCIETKNSQDSQYIKFISKYIFFQRNRKKNNIVKKLPFTLQRTTYIQPLRFF